MVPWRCKNALIGCRAVRRCDARSCSPSDAILATVRSVRCPVLVGREGDLHVLVDAVEGASEGRGTAVLLLGEAAIGRPRLVDAGATAARTRGMKVLRGRASTSPAPSSVQADRRGPPLYAANERTTTVSRSPLGPPGAQLDRPVLGSFGIRTSRRPLDRAAG